MRTALLSCVPLAFALAACSAQNGQPPARDGGAPDAPPSDAPAPPSDARAPGDDAGPATGLDADDMTPDQAPDGGGAPSDAAAPALAAGMNARTTAQWLNLRAGPSTADTVLTAMACGSSVQLLAGPANDHWWNVSFGATQGWASGTYLMPEALFSQAVCMAGAADAGGPPDDAGPPPPPTDPGGAFSRAQLAVGYSYYWGHGSWRDDGASPGSCSGTCPSCAHSGAYGADCSGFVAKCWQVPAASPITTDLHPYSTYNFRYETTHWTQVPRTQLEPADALVYNTSGHGHIMLFESGGDPWGNIWTYEARGCSTGVVHNLRVAGTEYIAIRREAQ